MTRRGMGSSVLEREIERATVAFLEGRLSEKTTFDWAARLGSHQIAERNALRNLLNYREPQLEEPYRAAWFWVCEAWDEPVWPEDTQLEMAEALGHGVSPLIFVRHVVELVRPRLSCEPARAPRRKTRPTEVSRLVSLNLGAENLLSLQELHLDGVEDIAFLSLLADKLENELVYGLARAARIGGSAVYLANWIERVYAVQLPEVNGGTSDPDAFRNGFAPLVKLLHEILAKLFVLDSDAARARVRGWRRYPEALFQRLWAAAAREPGLASAAEVSTFLRGLDTDRFWSLGHFPEIAELRARRFSELLPDDQAAIERRLLQTPPAALFLRRLGKAERDAARRSWVRRELRRIELDGGPASDAAQTWIANFTARGEAYTELTTVTSDIDNAYNFPWRTELGVYEVDDIKVLLPTLEEDLGETRYGGKSETARAYLADHADEILAALEGLEPGRYPAVLTRLVQSEANRGRNAAAGPDPVADIVLDALVRLPSAALADGVGDYAIWLDIWAKHFPADHRVWATWMRLWPSAVAVSNRSPAILDSSFDGQRKERDDRLAMEALNSPAGHLVSALFSVLPNLTVVPRPFQDDDLKAVRDMAFTAAGDVRLQVLHRFLSDLEYMRAADPEWAKVNLLDPLAQAEHQDLEIWDAIARRGLSPESLKIVGPKLVTVARGGSLPAKTRAGLARTVVFSVLRNLRDGNEPIIPLADAQQMLRLGGEPVRISAARALKAFLEAKGADPHAQYTSAVGPFLSQVWPADQTLRSSPLSDVLAELPAASGAAFADAVASIAPLIVPFEPWSLHAFGFFARLEGSHGSSSKAAPVMDKTTAPAWLDLLDRSIGRAEGSVYPRDLALALDAISAGDKALMNDPRFLRLVALVRR